MSVEDGVRAASARFYAALSAMASGDASAMTDAWWHDGSVTTMHPIGGREVGWDQVGPVWGQVAGVASGEQVGLSDQLISVGGDMACEVGTERGHIVLAGETVPVEHRATNVYRRQGTEWKLVHHHADHSSAMMDVLARLQAKG